MVQIGVSQVVRLIDKDLLPTKDKWEILEIIGESARVKNVKSGLTLRVHKSRLTDKDPTMAKKFVCDKCDRTFSTKSGLTLHKCKSQKGSSKMAKQATATATATEKKETKAKKTKKDLVEFDIKKFIQEHGGEHWVRGDRKFDHTGYKLETHAVMDEKAGYYYMLNDYTNNGVTSLGRGNKGITKYPLKGKKVSYVVSETSKKVEHRGQKRERKGTKNAEDVRKHWEKLGYSKS